MTIELSSEVVPSEFLVPLQRIPTASTSWGGVGIQDMSKGLFYKLWTAYYSNSSIFVQREGETPVKLLDTPTLVHLSLAFDQNMNPMLAYELEDGRAFLWWYDTTINNHTTTELIGARYPNVAIDDARPDLIFQSDCYVVYSTTAGLKYRKQSERYREEYLLSPILNRRVTQLGMTKGLRFCARHVHFNIGE